MCSVEDWATQGRIERHRHPAIPPPPERGGGIPQVVEPMGYEVDELPGRY